MLAVAILTALPMIATAQEPATAGTGAIASSQMGRKTHWQNWVFAGASIAIVAVGITCIALSQGSQPN